MSHMRICLAAVSVATAMSCNAAIAQTPVSPTTKPSPAASAPDISRPSIETPVETWTRKQWAAAKKEWAKDTAKWSDCEKQSTDQKLKGRKSWSFLYKCMTS
jgi:hypothetical protein